MKLNRIFSQSLLLAFLVIATGTCARADVRKVSIAKGDNCTDILKDGVSLRGAKEISLSSGDSVKIEVVPKTGYYLSMWTATGISKLDVTSSTYWSYYHSNPLTISYSDVPSGVGTLRPVTKEIYYYHVFNRGNSAATGAQMKTNLVTYLDGGTLPACTYKLAHGEFEGWEYDGRTYYAGSVYNRLSTVPGARVVFTAKWKVTECEVTFDKNLAAADLEWASKLYKVDEAYGELPSVSAADSIFEGWYTAKEGGRKIVETDTVKASITTLYAHWKSEKYGISFDGNGADSGTMSAVTIGSKKEELVLPANQFARLGYVFKGWEGSNGQKYADGATISNVAAAGETIVLKAIWEKSKYKVVFHPNAAKYEGETAAQSVEYGETVVMPKCGFKKEGGEFLGWARNPESAAEEWKAGARVKNLSSAENGVFHLHAIWKKENKIGEALGCKDLEFTTTGTWEKDGNWLKSKGGQAVLTTELPCAGTLTFTWKTDDSKDNFANYQFWIGSKSQWDVSSTSGISKTYTCTGKTKVSWKASGSKSLYVGKVTWKPNE